MNTYGLVLVRSDEGDGGWSLHTPEQIADAQAHNDAPEYMNAGPATLVDDEWDRPNQEDYIEASLMIKNQ
jgi:hypothetical protein